MRIWQRRLRLFIGLFAVAFAVVVVFAFRQRAPAAPPPPIVRTEPGVVVESTGGRVERFRLSREDVRVEYEKQLTYADGATKLVDVTIVTEDRNDGRSFTVTAKEGQVSQDESTIALTGDVRLVSSDGMTVRTVRASYADKEGIVNAEGPVDFSRGRMTGSGIGMTYDKQRDVLWILSEAVVHVAPDEAGSGAAEITSGTAGFARREKYMRFEPNAKVQRAGQVIESDSAIARLSADETRIETMELRNNSRITSGKTTAGALQALAGRDMDLKYAADGQTLEHALITSQAVIQVAGEQGRSGLQITANTIDISLAPDGATPTALIAREAVQLMLPAEQGAFARTIAAANMDAKGEAARGLTQATFTGNAQYRERGGAVDRTANANVLDVSMKPGMTAIQEARFARGVRFVDGKLTALAAAARYDPEKGVLELTGSEPAAPAPRVVTDQIAVDAARIDVTLAGPKMKAGGTVKSVLQPPPPKTGTRLPSMLKEDQPINVTANELDYDGNASRAIYTGNAQLWQGDTSIKAASIALDAKSGDLTASGKVTTVTMFDEVNKDKQKQRVRSIATANDFQYEEAVRRAIYQGDAHMSGPQGDLTATRIELSLKPSGDELDRAEAYENVTLRDQNRKTTGTHLTYTTSDEGYIVTGAPVTIVDECGRETIGKTLTYFKSADTLVVDGNEQTRTQTKGSSECR